MSRILMFVTLLALALVPFPTTVLASPQAQTDGAQGPFITQSLVDLGYTNDVTLQGSRASTDLAFPLPEAGITGGTLTLKLTSSQILDPLSTVQVFLNDRPALSTNVNKIAQDGTLAVSVPASSEQYLNVRVVGNLFLDDERCVLDSQDSLWVVIGNDSRLDYSYSLDNASIHEFLRLPGGQVVVRGLWDTPQHQNDSIALYSVLKNLYRSTPTQVLLAEDAGEAPANALRREVALSADAATAPLRLEDSTLSVGTGRTALNEILAQAGQSLLLGRTLNTLETVATSDQNASSSAKTTRQRTLAALGLQDQERSGTGEIPITTRFTLADMGGWPRNLRFSLDTGFDQVPTDTTERAVLRVRLNGTLLQTTDIRGKSSLQQTIALPNDLLRAENYLDVVFVYARQTGDCSSSPYAFTGQLRSTSGFTWDGYGTGHNDLPELIGSFSGEGDLYMFNVSPEMARSTAQLVGGLSAFTTAPLLTNVADTATLAQSKGAYRIVVGGDSAVAQSLKLPVDVNNEVMIVNPQNNTTIVRGTSDQPLVSAQYLAAGTPTLVVQAAEGADAALFDATIKQIVDPQRFFKLNGDVVVGDNSQILALNIGNDGLENRAPLAAGWQTSFDNYRWMLVVLAAALVAGLWWQIYSRVGKRPPMPTAPADTSADQTE